MSTQRVEVEVREGDAKDVETDLLVLKNADGAAGVGKEIASTIAFDTPDVWEELPGIGEFAVFDGGVTVQARKVMYGGVKPIPRFGYQDIRRFARRSLEIAARQSFSTEHVTFTLHGPGYGLDEREAFESELAGLMDAVQQATAPRELERISVVEIDSDRADRLDTILESFIPGETIDGEESTPEQARSVGYDSEGKPHVFVAMPFTEKFEDVYYLGIKEAVNDAGFLCERIDDEAFTGNIAEQIRQRIESATLVVADLTDANPNVYLEVGYAWGEDVPTLLLTQNTDDLQFDVQHHNAITYDRHGIHELQENLSETLSELDVRDDGPPQL